MDGKSCFCPLPDDVIIIIHEHLAARQIQTVAYMMFYKKYGLKWKDYIHNYENDLDYYCYLNGIVDPWYDYIKYLS